MGYSSDNKIGHFVLSSVKTAVLVLYLFIPCQEI